MIDVFFSIASALYQKSSSDAAADRIRQAGEYNAQLSELETAELIGRQEYAFNQEQGERIVSYAKSGVKMEGTPLIVMAEANNVAQREIAFIREQGRRTATARRKGASGQARAMETQGNTLMIQGLSNAASKLWEIG